MRLEHYFDLKGRMRFIVLYGVFQFFLLTFLAAFFYPGGYDYFSYYFSDLGAVTARNNQANTVSAMFFFIALTTVSITLVPFWLGLLRFFNQSRAERISSHLGSVMGLICSPIFIGVALCPLDTQLEIHFVLVMAQFSLFSFAVLLYSMAVLQSERYPWLYGLFGLIVLSIGVTILFDSVGQYAALLQKIVVYSYFFWVIVMMYLVTSRSDNEIHVYK